MFLSSENNMKQGADMTVGHNNNWMHLVIRNIWKHSWKCLIAEICENKIKELYSGKN